MKGTICIILTTKCLSEGFDSLLDKNIMGIMWIIASNVYFLYVNTRLNYAFKEINEIEN